MFDGQKSIRGGIPIVFREYPGLTQKIIVLHYTNTDYVILIQTTYNICSLRQINVWIIKPGLYRTVGGWVVRLCFGWKIGELFIGVSHINISRYCSKQKRFRGFSKYEKYSNIIVIVIFIKITKMAKQTVEWI